MIDLKDLNARIDNLDLLIRPFMCLQVGTEAEEFLRQQSDCASDLHFYRYRGLPMFKAFPGQPPAAWRLVDMRVARGKDEPEPA